MELNFKKTASSRSTITEYESKGLINSKNSSENLVAIDGGNLP
ncbi:MAG: hypothetical protein BAJALOKI3v1_380001, partial [Promethearchaeota archaeon]